MIERVTFTGADNSIHPSDLVEISNDYPWVEWGILFPSGIQGYGRFPNFDWVSQLKAIKRLEKFPHTTMDGYFHDPINLSMHLCEPMVYQLVTEGLPLEKIMKEHSIPNIFSRAQINTHGMTYRINDAFIEEMRRHPEIEFILQVDEGNHFMYDLELENVAVFQDFSSGAGIFENSWLDFGDRKYGYSGGLNINTLPLAIEVWEKRNKTINWIDMETGVRTKGKFDLAKVREVCEYIEPYISNSVVKV